MILGHGIDKKWDEQVFRELLTYMMADADAVKRAPVTTPVRRLDDVRAAKQLDVAWQAHVTE